MQERVENEQGAGANDPKPPTPPQPTDAPPRSPFPSDTPAPEPTPPEPVDPTIAAGRWECLNTVECKLAAPDPRTPGKYFDGPTQRQIRVAGSAAPVTCPECGGTKVIYRGDKTPAAVAA